MGERRERGGEREKGEDREEGSWGGAREGGSKILNVIKVTSYTLAVHSNVNYKKNTEFSEI